MLNEQKLRMALGRAISSNEKKLTELDEDITEYYITIGKIEAYRAILNNVEELK